MAVKTLDQYKDNYNNIKFERDEDGILLVTFHTNGSDILFGPEAHDEVSEVWRDIASDPETRVVILTGAGDTFIDLETPIEDPKNFLTPQVFHYLHRDAKRIVLDHLEIEVPMIAAVNGPARYHNELALMCDIVIASDDAVFGDKPHFGQGVVPGDGMQIIWPLVIGFNRGRYFLLTGQEISAQQALEWGAVNEVVPKKLVVDRAYELARSIAEKPTLTLKSVRALMVNELKRTMMTAVSQGIMMETLVGIGEGWAPVPRTTLQPSKLNLEQAD